VLGTRATEEKQRELSDRVQHAEAAIIRLRDLEIEARILADISKSPTTALQPRSRVEEPVRMKPSNGGIRGNYVI
jgi:hypothetical protein